jgi:hypothetical protein
MSVVGTKPLNWNVGSSVAFGAKPDMTQPGLPSRSHAIRELVIPGAGRRRRQERQEAEGLTAFSRLAASFIWAIRTIMIKMLAICANSTRRAASRPIVLGVMASRDCWGVKSRRIS